MSNLQALIEYHKELNRIRSKRFRLNNLERSKQLKANWRMKNKEYISKTRFEKQEAILVAQAGRPRAEVCELCGDKSKNKHGSCKTVFDHNHSTGQFRGWICNTCNRTLGLAKDSPELLRRMADYVESEGKLGLSVSESIAYLEKQ